MTPFALAFMSISFVAVSGLFHLDLRHAIQPRREG